MPEHVVILELALGRDLGRLGLQLLEADDVGPVARQPFAELGLARADAVHVPGCDFHATILEVLDLPRGFFTDAPPRGGLS